LHEHEQDQENGEDTENGSENDTHVTTADLLV
jgi:hypothetical protein